MNRKLLIIPILSSFLLAAPAFAAQNPVNIPAGNGTSQNWSGYVASGSEYSTVSGSWNIPTPSIPDNQLAADATWVGIGGVSSSDLIQAGTQAIVNDGTITYEAWYETLPQAQQIIPVTVHGGDSVSVSVNEVGTNLWQISFTDNTTGENYSTTISYTSTNSSAEWIEEQPSAEDGMSLGYVPIDNFDNITFTNAYTTANGTQENLAETNPQALTMATNDMQALAEPSSIVNNASFSITRSAVSSEVSEPEAISSVGRSWHRSGVRVSHFNPGQNMRHVWFRVVFLNN